MSIRCHDQIEHRPFRNGLDQPSHSRGGIYRQKGTYNRVRTHSQFNIPRPCRRVKATTVCSFARSGTKVGFGYACREGLEYRRRGLAPSTPMLSFVAYLASFFAVGSWVRYGCNFVFGGDGGVPKATEMVPGCGEKMRPCVIGGNRGEG